MTNLSFKFIQILLLSGLLLFFGCHQEPALPTTLIPPGCRLGLATYINENTSDSTAYLHDSFGYVLQSSATRKEKGRVVRQLVNTFSYTDDHYLSNRVDRLTISAANGQTNTSNGTFVYEYAGTPKRIQAIKRINTTGSLDSPLTITYQYTGDQLTQYSEVDGNGTSSYQVVFGADGKLKGIQIPNNQEIEILNGLISKTISGKDTVRFTYDGQNQLVSQDFVYGATKERVIRELTYDGRQPTRTGELRLPGFPTNTVSGYGQAKSNVLTETIRRFRNGFLTETTPLRYTYSFNGEGYPTGYARTDGTRARFYYTNCP